VAIEKREEREARGAQAWRREEKLCKSVKALSAEEEGERRRTNKLLLYEKIYIRRNENEEI